ncbi:MAG: WecB/TagA/CpsF family glycosyltransferase [Gallionella sp.]|jgi:N-acetylglucosaminyldiphosphoundecaprenol N-acetyl-beta-D-mannosaminyltransferase
MKNKSTTEDILSYATCTLTLDQLVDSVVERVRSNMGCGWLACLNPHSYVVALDDVEFTQALNDADWLVPDGSGIVLASKVLGGGIRQRITGSDIFYGLNSRMNAIGNFSVFFLGASEECLADIRVRMAHDYPNVRFAGCYSPPFKPVYSECEISDMISAINESGADVLWVGMTAPKQEKWIYAHSERLTVKFAAAIGAVFDFYTGRVKRSHPIFQRLGLEWLPRLIQEPRRLWQRNFVSTPVFLFNLLKCKVGLK